MKVTKTILFCLFSISIFAQSVEMPFENGIWSYSLGIGSDDGFQTYCHSYFSTGDTTINGKEYFKIEQDQIPDREVFFREENSKIYFIPNPALFEFEWNETSEEFLVFDFSVEIGDSVTIYNFFNLDLPVGYSSWKLEVTSVEMIEVGGALRKQIMFGGMLPPDFDYQGCGFRWVEGVGEVLQHPFYFWPSFPQHCLSVDVDYNFSCLEIGGEEIFGNCFCTDTTTPTQEALTSQIQIFPNPSNGAFHISNPMALEIEIAVYNNFGQLIETNSNEKIDLSNYANGLYYALIKTKSDNFVEQLIKNN